MALDKAIERRKERRQPYWDSRRVDPSCRNHSCCGWCEGNRLYQRRKLEAAARDESAKLSGGRPILSMPE